MRVIAILSLLVSLFVSFHVMLVFTGNTYFYNVLKLTIFKGRLGPSLTDYKKFPNDTLKTNIPKYWKEGEIKQAPEFLIEANKDFKTTAFLVIKNNEIVYENYAEGFSENIPSNSFSMAKSFVSALVGVAIQQGKIESVEQTIGDFLPDFKDKPHASITIKQLLQMSSGIGFDENYLNPFAFPAKAYYGKNLRQLMHDYQVVEEPGIYFEYQGGATQLLAFIVEEATGKSLSTYFQEEIWQKVGAETESYWILDEPNGNEKASCCIIATARDFAKFGKLYLDNGRIDSAQIIPEWYIQESVSPSGLLDKEDNERVHFYGYQWWMGNYKNLDYFYARGILGQYIICVPEKDLIIVRLGHKRSKERTNKHPNDFFIWLDVGLEIGK